MTAGSVLASFAMPFGTTCTVESVELLLDSDVDVVYWDPGNATPERDIAIEKHLFEQYADIPWSVHNQARMHERNGDAPYRNTEDAIRCWPETATAIAARLSGTRVEVLAPHGVQDLVNLIVRPTPAFAQSSPSIAPEFLQRIGRGAGPGCISACRAGCRRSRNPPLSVGEGGLRLRLQSALHADHGGFTAVAL